MPDASDDRVACDKVLGGDLGERLARRARAADDDARARAPERPGGFRHDADAGCGWRIEWVRQGDAHRSGQALQGPGYDVAYKDRHDDHARRTTQQAHTVAQP